MKTSWPFGEMQLFGYDVIVADPPWTFELRSAAGEGKSPQAQYECMSLDAIKALPVGQLARGDCLLLLWTCGWAMATCQAQAVATAWGFTPVTEMSWRKTTTSGAVRMGPGYRVRTMHEPILVCTLGNPEHRALESADRFDIRLDGVARQHSRKPVEFYEHVAACTPGALRRADLFSRETRPGFEGWGHEATKFDEPNSGMDHAATSPVVGKHGATSGVEHGARPGEGPDNLHAGRAFTFDLPDIPECLRRQRSVA